MAVVSKYDLKYFW